MTNRVCYLLILTLLTVLLGCGEGVHVLPHQQPEQPIATKDAIWQQAWVDPEVIYSDSLFTLIRADRIDSFLVAPGTISPEIPDISVQSPRPARGAGAIKFQIWAGSCTPTVTLTGGSIAISSDLPRNLPVGFYKLTCDLSGVSPGHFPLGSYRVKITYCGASKSGTLIK